jgi:hypothetical protein
MPTIRNSEQASRLARLRWERQRQREAEEAAVPVRLAEGWVDDVLSLTILTKSEQARLIGAALRQGAEGAAREVAPSVIIAAAELGIDRATAERIADLAMLLTAAAIEQAGGPEVVMPTPEAWRATVAWDAIYARTASRWSRAQSRASRRPRWPRPAGAAPPADPPRLGHDPRAPVGSPWMRSGGLPATPP